MKTEKEIYLQAKTLLNDLEKYNEKNPSVLNCDDNLCDNDECVLLKGLRQFIHGYELCNKTKDNSSATFRRTKQDLEGIFPLELLAELEPDDVWAIEQFKLKAMTIGVTLEEIEAIDGILKKQN